MQSRIGLFAFVLLLSAPLMEAATLEGNVYDLYLNPLMNAIVRVNTFPSQTKVASDGRYSFIVKPGNYVITASSKGTQSFSVVENVTIKEEGTFIIDLILLPDFSDDTLDSDLSLEEGPPVSTTLFILTLIILLFVLVALLFKKRPQHSHPHFTHEEAAQIPTEAEEDKQAIYTFIKNQEGRTTQKDIRKNHAHFSEAKISLIIAELEHDGKIKKIKRGRGNIIVLIS